LALLLSIDTSTRGCTAALHQDEQLLANYELLAERSSSGMLTTLIQNVVEHSGFDLTQLDAIAVAKGPGSYTGLRIAVSTAKGLCFALDKPLISVSTLEAMTAQVAYFYDHDVLFCPMIDARRMEVFCAVLDRDLQYVKLTEAKIIDSESFSELLAAHQTVFFGDGAAKCQTFLGTHPNAVFLFQPIYPSAKTVGQLAFQKWQRGAFEEVISFEPYYLKDFVGTVPKAKT
jgi:tRNA threonylcarbamoyladenosine biosynthesis protein TsaB